MKNVYPRQFLLTLLAVASLCLAAVAPAKDVQSNGLGGGRWSEASTWRGGAVPAPEDDAVIASRDTVLFDRDDVETPSCKQLILDPNSNLAFQSGLGRRTLTVNGPIDAYGSLKMHAAATTDQMEIRLASTVDAERAIRLQHGGALLVLGRADLADGRRNAVISVSAPPASTAICTGQLTAGARSMIDLQNALVDNIAISVSTIDNTGAKPSERCHFSGNLFIGAATLAVASCDTPVIIKNEFDSQRSSVRGWEIKSPKAVVRSGAISVSSCPLADIRQNRIQGPYAIGISMNTSEGSVTGNLIEDCPEGILWSSGPAMMKQNTLRHCKFGLELNSVTGSAEDTLIDGSDHPVSTNAAKVQLTSLAITNPAKAVYLEMTAGSVNLLNCNVRPEQIKFKPDASTSKKTDLAEPAVETLQFLVVSVKGTVPQRTQIQVLTTHPATALPPGAVDMNIRNSPALIRTNGLTALPQSLTPLIVKSWTMDEDGKVAPAPEYTLNVLEPATEAGAKPRIVKTLSLKVDDTWYRPKPDDPTPTLEIQPL